MLNSHSTTQPEAGAGSHGHERRLRLRVGGVELEPEEYVV